MEYRNIYISCGKNVGQQLGESLANALRQRRYTVFVGTGLEGIVSSTDFLLILTPDCMSNIQRENDWIRMQIETAKREHKNIVPILADGFHFPAELPESIESIRNCRAVHANGDTLGITMDSLCKNYLESEPRKDYTKLYVFLGIMAAVLLALYLFRNQIIPLIIPQATVAGVVTDAGTGAPVAGVLIAEGTTSQKTDENGTYKMTVKPGDHTFVYTCDGYEETEKSYSLNRNDEADGSITISDGKGYVTGRVVRKMDEGAVIGASVACGTEAAITNGNGEYSLYLEKGEQLLTISAEEYEQATERVQIEADTSITKDISLSTGKGYVTGRVVRKMDEGAVAGASVACGTETAVTDGNGEYSLYLEKGEQLLTISAEEYEQATERVQIEADTSVTKNISLSTGMGYVSGRVINAVDGSTLPGVSVACGNQRVTTDQNGDFSIAADEGSYTLCFEMNGFIAENKEVTIRKDNRITCDAALSPEMQSDQYRVVLTWGIRPTDLDSHLIWSKDHIYFSHKISSESDAQLDLDDTHSYGPETTTFTMLPGETYKFFVHNFSDEASMANCGAQVAIYCGTNHLATRTVPASGNGRYWEVFTLRDGDITYGEQIQAREPELNS